MTQTATVILSSSIGGDGFSHAAGDQVEMPAYQAARYCAAAMAEPATDEDAAVIEAAEEPEPVEPGDELKTSSDDAGGGGEDSTAATASDDSDPFGGLAIGERVRDALTAAGVADLQQLRAVEDYAKLPGIGKASAKEIAAALAELPE